MATRTEPITMLLYLPLPTTDNLRPLLGWSGVAAWSVVPGPAARLSVRLPFPGDELVEPADLALDRLQPVTLQLKGVAVDPLPGPGQPGAERIDPLLKPAAPALKDPEPDVRPGLAEECEAHAEAVVFPGRGASLGQQILQPLLAVGGQPVDNLGPASGQRARGVGQCVLGDQAAEGQVLQARVQRAVAEGPERAEQGIQLLAQFIAVHRGLVQQSENGELEHARALGAHRRLVPPAMMWATIHQTAARLHIFPMYRVDTLLRYVVYCWGASSGCSPTGRYRPSAARTRLERRSVVACRS